MRVLNFKMFIHINKLIRFISATRARRCESSLANSSSNLSFYFAGFLLLNFINIGLCNNYANESLAANHVISDDGSTTFIWSDFLEDYVLSQSSSSRKSKDLPFMNGYNEMSGHAPMQHHMPHPGTQNGPINYHSSAYKRPNGHIFITKRIGEAFELEPHMRPPVDPPVVNSQFRPMTNQMLLQQQQQRQQPGFFQQLFGLGGDTTQAPPHQPQQHVRPVTLPQQQIPQQQQHLGQHGAQQPPFRAVSENDLYLLGAIEKLVYRVDYLESRVRRAEQLIYYLMAGNNQKEVRDPCPTNFTRISDNCYYINSQQQVNWKTANSACKALGAHLTEFERVSENEEIMAYLLNQPNHRGRDYWLGGLNPGLLWIWSNSAKPVNPNTNLTSIAMTQKAENEKDVNATATNLVDQGDDDDAEKQKKQKEDAILNNTVEIKGQGRCLRLTYNPTKHTYSYYGQECTTRHHYICETEDKTLDNKIKKITRELKLFD